MIGVRDKLAELRASSFRAKFHLAQSDMRYVHERGIDAVVSHAREFISTRLAPAHPPNDGKQTPWRGHPVFIAQHATATCCRGCVQKWHGFARGVELSDDQQRYILELIRAWIDAEMIRHPVNQPAQGQLFGEE
jgi:hypothetical protein